MKFLTALIISAYACLMGSHALAADGIGVSNAWARASIGKARAGIAYVTIENTGKSADRLVAVGSDVSKKTEIHTHIMKDDVMMMRQIEGIDIPAGGKVLLKPGSYHVMLIGLHGPLKEGTSFPLTMTFEKAGKLKTVVHIQKTASMKKMTK